MIDASVIRTMAAQEKLDPGIVEKDYVISKALTALAEVEEFRSALVFKGGTALKKCFYRQWRFSEDLDFTSRTDLTPNDVKSIFEKACATATRQSGLSIRVSEYSQYPKTGNKITTAQLKLGYDGPLRKSSGQKNNVRVDIAFDERIIEKPEKRTMLESYPDDEHTELAVYALEEIVAEKMRSILQRGKSRDYYDVWLLHEDYAGDLNLSKVKSLLVAKCADKEIAKPKTQDFFDESRLGEAERFWIRGLAHQMENLPKFESVIAALRRDVQRLLES